jgi:Cft2 family RNA processing exonuclease
VHINGVRFSFHPAGHILGSSQIRVEYKGEVWVFSGDYKLEHDGFSAGFEPVKCHTFISESTFGLPVYRWKPQAEVFEEMNRWWAQNAAQGVCSVVVAYSLGKAQRILTYLDQSIGRVYAHPSIFTMHQTMRENGFQLPEDYLFDRNQKKEEYKSRGEFDTEIIIFPENEMNAISHNTRYQLFRVIQELFTNTSKHAKATKVVLSCTVFDEQINIIFEDNGSGFDFSKETGIGLRNIKERLSVINGTIVIESNKGTGTTIIIDIPRYGN